ncbi:hypothetical protein [Streptomyces sp. MMG1533]|uniref:hypothetical protein n=1 Tax=Streptomyces sp. MMG1533 TaxID=1415546 RepID=UPI00131BBD0B|nr:hypothetical protein [Streptomyces sp. MMG1533]
MKELPAEHRLLEARAVAVTLTKRRRGKANSRTTVHWSVDEDRQLRTMGSFYLLLHRLMGHSRAFSGSGSVWSIWAGNGRGGDLNAATGGHIGPFDAELARKLKLGAWAERHGLVGDDGKPLQMMVTGIKKTVEVRTAKQVGGHLPSARATNTADTSFTHYLRKGPFVAEWAADVLTEAITDAEESARAVVVRLGLHLRTPLPAVSTGPPGLDRRSHQPTPLPDPILPEMDHKPSPHPRTDRPLHPQARAPEPARRERSMAAPPALSHRRCPAYGRAGCRRDHPAVRSVHRTPLPSDARAPQVR